MERQPVVLEGVRQQPLPQHLRGRDGRPGVRQQPRGPKRHPVRTRPAQPYGPSLMDGRRQFEYDLILAEDDAHVVFLVSGREVKVPRGVLEFDEEGRFWLTPEVAAGLGLTPA